MVECLVREVAVRAEKLVPNFKHTNWLQNSYHVVTATLPSRREREALL